MHVGSRSRWHEPTRSAARGAQTSCAPGKNNPKSSDTSLDLIHTLRSFGQSFTILKGLISPGSGACTAWPSCLRVLCTCLRVPYLCFGVCQSACVGRHHVPARACGACAGPSCANALHWSAHAFPVPQLTSSMHKAKEKGHRAQGQNKIMHAYMIKSTPIAQWLVGDIKARHAYGPRSAPIAQGLVYDINAPHAFGLRELKRTYGFLSTPIAQGLVTIINAKDQKC